jgi:hypothetical protein
MAQQIINIGAAPNDGSGDNPRAAFDKCNQNFTELYGGRLLAVQVFSTAGSTTYTPTAGMVNCIIETLGAGAGAGGVGTAASNYYAGSGGGSGAYSRAFKTAAQVGASQNVTVGAKGTGSSNANGTAGGDSFVGANLAASLCGAKGGSGGLRVNAAVGAAPLGGAGGLASGGVGDVKAGGNAGGPGIYIALPTFVIQTASGFGGSSCFGGAPSGVVWTVTSGATAGTNAAAYGSGGSGAAGNDSGSAKGGDGSDGIVIITEYR